MWPRNFFFAIFCRETKEMVLKAFGILFFNSKLHKKTFLPLLSHFVLLLPIINFHPSSSLPSFPPPSGLVKTASLCWTRGDGGIRWCSVKNILGGESGVRFNKESTKKIRQFPRKCLSDLDILKQKKYSTRRKNARQNTLIPKPCWLVWGERDNVVIIASH